MRKMLLGGILACVCFSGTAFAADDQVTLGAKAGAAAREIKDNADQSYAVGSAKAIETQEKLKVESQDVLQSFQKQWDQFSNQFQISTQQIQQDLQKQWEDFSKSFNQKK